MTFEPLQDRVVLVRINIEQKTTSGLVLPTTDVSAGDFFFGKVIASGPGKAYDSGGIIPNLLKEGDLVAFAPNTARRLFDKGVEYFILREGDIASVVREVEESTLPVYNETHFQQPVRELESLA